MEAKGNRLNGFQFRMSLGHGAKAAVLMGQQSELLANQVPIIATASSKEGILVRWHARFRDGAPN